MEIRSFLFVIFATTCCLIVYVNSAALPSDNDVSAVDNTSKGKALTKLFINNNLY